MADLDWLSLGVLGPTPLFAGNLLQTFALARFLASEKIYKLEYDPVGSCFKSTVIIKGRAALWAIPTFFHSLEAAFTNVVTAVR